MNTCDGMDNTNQATLTMRVELPLHRHMMGKIGIYLQHTDCKEMTMC